MKYYELENPDTQPHGRWYLNGLHDSAGIQLDSRVFGYGYPVDLRPPLRLPLAEDGRLVEVTPPCHVLLRRDGDPLDVTFADFGIPIVPPRVACILAAVAAHDIQTFPVRVAHRIQHYQIINLVTRLPCIDTQRSNIQWWSEADNQPDKIGTPLAIYKLVIDPAKALGHHLLRPEGWEVALIVSEEVKRAFEAESVYGVTFREV